MGKFNSVDNSNLYQEVAGAMPGEYAMPAYFNTRLYYGGRVAPLRSFAFSKALLGASPTSSSSVSFAYPGTTPGVSANGTKNAIVWAIRNAGTHGVLHAFDAYDLGVEFYNSDAVPGGRDTFQDNKFVTPTIANGKVFVGTPNTVAVFGLFNLPGSSPRVPQRHPRAAMKHH